MSWWSWRSKARSGTVKKAWFGPITLLLFCCIMYIMHPSMRHFQEYFEIDFDYYRVDMYGGILISKNVSHKERCETIGSQIRVNPSKNKYTKKSFAPMLAVPLNSEKELSAFKLEFEPPSCFRVVAIVAGFNEGDVLKSSLTALLSQNVDVHFIDNWSTDNSTDSVKQLQQLYPNRITMEMIPEKEGNTYNWAAILERKMQLAKSLQADWVLHMDPDEIRESPWGLNVTLQQALFVVDELGFNLVNFGKLLVFHPVNTTKYNPNKESLRNSFLHYSLNSFSGDGVQIKAWKTYFSTCQGKFLTKRHVSPDFVGSGGHYVFFNRSAEFSFPRHKLFPFDFFLRHYPIRSQEHGMRKVFAERKSRWNVTEKTLMQWHTQYDDIAVGHKFVKHKKGLKRVQHNGDLPTKLRSPFLPCRLRI